MSRDTDSSGSSSPEPELLSERKRKRTVEHDELEVDLSLPAPKSKKELRLAKKAKTTPAKAAVTKDEITEKIEGETTVEEKTEAPAKSEWAIWIGNMLWSTSKDNLKDFFHKGGIAKDDITRVHMPPPAPKGPNWKGPKPINKGFAYVDFRTEADMIQAIAMSETLLDGRKVLIKNAKSFEGRPEQKAGDTAIATEKAPSRKIFVGNLAFDTTVDDVRELFSHAGPIKDVFLTTFEDSGKCKGYGWVEFKTLEAAEAANRGYVMKEEEAEEEEEGKDPAKAKKPRKWFINRLNGRQLRTEYAEDSQTRYKKRFGKGKTDQDGGHAEKPSYKPIKGMDKDERQALRRQKHEDARQVRPGRALANAQRASAAIVSAAGTKTTFD